MPLLSYFRYSPAEQPHQHIAGEHRRQGKKGTPIRMNRPCRDLSLPAQNTAGGDIGAGSHGVRLPPSVAPTSSPKHSTV